MSKRKKKPKDLRDEFAMAALTGYAANERVMSKAIDDWNGNGGLRPT